MNEIEKLYENAGFIKTKGNCDVCPLDVRTCKRGYSECPYIYPPFTAEKQLELIKYLELNDFMDTLRIVYRPFEKVWLLQAFAISEFANEEPNIYIGKGVEFNIAIANLINVLWQDLTEQEKEQIRNILAR